MQVGTLFLSLETKTFFDVNVYTIHIITSICVTLGSFRFFNIIQYYYTQIFQFIHVLMYEKKLKNSVSGVKLKKNLKHGEREEFEQLNQNVIENY